MHLIKWEYFPNEFDDVMVLRATRPRPSVATWFNAITQNNLYFNCFQNLYMQ